jgi:hypothetical protein
MHKYRGFHGLLAILLVISVSLAAHPTDKNSRTKNAPRSGAVLWTDPGDPSQFDFQYGVGGAERQPRPPFRFLNEDLSRSTPKINVIDANGLKWNVKWGHEARPSSFCTRLISACGYFADTEYFIASGRIDGARDLQRARTRVASNGAFKNARFQLRSDSPRYLDDEHWTFKKNPFVGTPEFQGLKILVLLLSNWDTRNSNFGIFSDDSTGQERFLYAHTDWGAALGNWGNGLTRSKGECKDFAKQTRRFVKGVRDDVVDFGFGGELEDIHVSDVRWLLQYLGKITDGQIRTGLLYSGESLEDADCYTTALKQRIEQLQQVATQSSTSAKQ